jgi:hypothetical protein
MDIEFVNPFPSPKIRWEYHGIRLYWAQHGGCRGTYSTNIWNEEMVVF